MQAKDLLTAIQIDATGELKKLSSYKYVFVQNGEQPTNRLTIEVRKDSVVLHKQANERLTVKRLIQVLNETKEAQLFFEEQQLFGYKLIEEGIFLG